MIGGLIGNRSGPNVEVMNSFELEFNFSDHDIIIDKEKCRNKQQECNLNTDIKTKSNFLSEFAFIVVFFPIFCRCIDKDKQPSTDSEFLGWYSIGNHPTKENIQVHKQICEINKSSIMLQLSSQSWKIDVEYIFQISSFFLCIQHKIYLLVIFFSKQLPVQSENEISHVNLPYKSFFVYAINEKLKKLNQLDLLIKQNNKDYHEALVNKLNEMIQKQSTNHKALMDKLDGFMGKLDGMSEENSTNHKALMDKLDKLIEATQPRESPIWAIMINQVLWLLSFSLTIIGSNYAHIVEKIFALPIILCCSVFMIFFYFLFILFN